MVGFLAFLGFGCSFMPVYAVGRDSASCIFPFVFDGKSYSSCTRDGAMDERLWCATTANYDRDGQWKSCSLHEYGGNSGGDSCTFPFIYKNRTFYTCTEEEKSGFWCSTTRNYDKDLKWSYCADIRLDANPKGPCVFPFIYNLTSYSSCTTDGISNMRPWCSLTENYDADLQWTYCEPSDPKPDPELESPTCLFPFIFKNKSYSTCTGEGMNDGELWCATTNNYDADKKWVYCNVTGPDENVESPPCVFPFLYNGKLYLSCTADGQRDGSFWCATTKNYDADRKWKFCQEPGPDPNIKSPACFFPFIYKGKSYSTCTIEGLRDGKWWCASTSNYDVDKKWIYCNVTEPDKNVKSPPCVFPFIFNGKVYRSCTADGQSSGHFWCATTSNYDADQKWKFCEEVSGPDPKVESPSCVFPFIYKGSSYTTCTPDGMSDGEHWCATSSNYDVDKKWMRCNITEPDASQDISQCVFPFIYNNKNYSSCTQDGRRDGKLWCATTSNYDTDKKLVLCTITKTGCVFPFIYKGKAYQSCIRLDHNEGKAWCATTPDYQTGLKWRLCNETDCVFPFVFRGKSYHSCTRDGRADNMRWCSLTSNADANMTWLLC